MTNPHTESFDTRLDEILDTFIAVYKDTLNGRDNRTHNTAKQAIRELVLSEIGEDEPNSAPREAWGASYRNELRAELRARINGGKDE